LKKGRKKSESHLVRILRNYFDSLGYITTTELSLGYGRADLVAFNIDTNRCKARLNNGQHRSLDKLKYYNLLRLIPEIESDESISLYNLSEHLKLSQSHLRQNLLSFLIRFGYIIEVNHKRYAKVNGYIPIADEILAVEVKVSDWRRGAIQAKRYQVFANRVFLAISNYYAHRVDRSLLEDHNIGLLTVGHKIYEDLKAPQLLPRDLNRFNFAAEWVWRYRRNNIREMVQNASK
jgi:hypothetical protein